MRVIEDAWESADLPHGSVVTVGNFDGLHRGQMAIIEKVAERAAAAGLVATVVTFEPHPLAVLGSGAAPARLTTPGQRLELLARAAVDLLAIVRFNPRLAATPAVRFVEEFLHRRLGAREIYVGSRFAFGRQREGDLSLLGRLGERLGFRAAGVDEILYRGEPISSTRIRRAVEAGRVSEAGEMLGRPYAVVGRVGHGEGRGKELGWPTLNLEVENELLPADGVYVSRARLIDRESLLGAITNVGRRPTFDGEGDRVVESHLFDFRGDLYGQRVELGFLERLRGERAFPSAAALASQIERDAGSAREYLEGSSRYQEGRPAEDRTRSDETSKRGHDRWHPKK